MSGHGVVPKDPSARRTRHVPVRGDWKPTIGVGWQHTPYPVAPAGLMPASVEAWKTWLGAWYAAHWTPDDLPLLRRLILLFDQVERGEFHRSAEFRMLADNLGVTPKGQQDRRWAPPKPETAAESASVAAQGGRYAHLKVVGGS